MAERESNQRGRAAAGIGIALAAAAAAAAGAYFLYGKDGEKNRRKVRAWALKLRGEVLERMEQMKDMNEELYLGLIESVKNRYAVLKNVDSRELAQVISELRGHWRNIRNQMNEGKRSSRKPAARRPRRRQAKPPQNE